MCFRDALFERPDLTFSQECQRRGVCFGTLDYLWVCTAVDPFRLTVVNRKDRKCRYRNRGVLLILVRNLVRNGRHEDGVTRKVALSTDATVRIRSPLLAKLPYGVSEAQDSQVVLLQSRKADQIGTCQVVGVGVRPAIETLLSWAPVRR
jgi:hypothetical protein